MSTRGILSVRYGMILSTAKYSGSGLIVNSRLPSTGFSPKYQGVATGGVCGISIMNPECPDIGYGYLTVELGGVYNALVAEFVIELECGDGCGIFL